MTKVELSADVVFQQLDDEAVLLHLPTERYFGLNGVGTRVWQILQTGTTIEECVTQIAAEYDASAGTIDQDVNTLIEQLVQRNLVKVVS